MAEPRADLWAFIHDAAHHLNCGAFCAQVTPLPDPVTPTLCQRGLACLFREADKQQTSQPGTDHECAFIHRFSESARSTHESGTLARNRGFKRLKLGSFPS